jgi:hypothetical protein
LADPLVRVREPQEKDLDRGAALGRGMVAWRKHRD